MQEDGIGASVNKLRYYVETELRPRNRSDIRTGKGCTKYCKEYPERYQSRQS